MYTIFILFSRSLTLALIIVGSVLQSTAHAKFFDVELDHQYFDAIQYLGVQGIVRGYENRSYQPERTINRAEFTKILMTTVFPQEVIDSCLETAKELEGDVPSFSFPDVPQDAWFTPYICTAWLNGIVSGYPDGFFRPEEGVQFVESAKMLSLAFGLTGVELPNFGANNAFWYTPYVEFLAAYNAIPFSISSFEKNINRGEMAELIYRLKDYPLGIAPITNKTKTVEDVLYPVAWQPYANRDYTVAFSYPNVWPEPDVLPRGFYDGRNPYVRSEWSIFFGPLDSQTCLEGQRCTERDMWIDGFRLNDADAIVNAIKEDVFFITLEEETIINGLPTLITLEEVGDCIDKRAFFFGKQWVYALSMRCAGQDDSLYKTFDQLVLTFQELKEKELEHR